MQSSLAEFFYNQAVDDAEYLVRVGDAYVVATLQCDVNDYPELEDNGAVLVWADKDNNGLGYLLFKTVEEAKALLFDAHNSNGTNH